MTKSLSLNIIYVTAILLCVAMGACRSSRHATGTATLSHWHTVEVPVKVVIDHPANMSLSGRATLVRDSSVYVSMRMLGMEVAFATADNDSVTLCDKYHKIYVSEALAALLPQKYASIGQLQRIMLGCTLPEELTGHISVSDPVNTPLGQAHQTINVDASAGKSEIKATLIYQFDKAVWDGQARKSPSVPRGAQRIDAAKLLKSLQ